MLITIHVHLLFPLTCCPTWKMSALHRNQWYMFTCFLAIFLKENIFQKSNDQYMSQKFWAVKNDSEHVSFTTTPPIPCLNTLN